MSLNPIVRQHNSPPGQISSPPNKEGGEAFGQMTQSGGYSKGELERAETNRAKSSRTGKIGKSHKPKSSQLASLNLQGQFEEEPVYRTVMGENGEVFTLRLLAVA